MGRINSRASPGTPRRGRREPSGAPARWGHCGPRAVYGHADLGVGYGASVKLKTPRTESQQPGSPRRREGAGLTDGGRRRGVLCAFSVLTFL